MSNSLQNHLLQATPAAMRRLETALNRLPDDKRNWKASENSRSALNQIAECAILNGVTAQIIPTKTWPSTFDFAQYYADTEELAKDENRALALLHENTAKVVEVIAQVPDEDLGIEIAMPWGTQTLSEILAYCDWNMSYHEGQINFIASLLGCLD